MVWFVLAFGLLTLLLDLNYFRRRMGGRPRRVRRLFILLTAATDLLPLVAWGLFRLLPDNPGPVVTACMWLFFVYLLTVLPRWAFYLFDLFGRRRAGSVAALCVAAILLWGATCGRTHYRINEVEIRSERLPAGFDGVRIVHFSDLHLGSLVRPVRETERLVRRIESLRPDMIVFTGDLVNIRYTELDGSLMRQLGRLRTPLGVWSNIGNHDTGVYIRDSLALPVPVNMDSLAARQRRMGWRLPDDETVWLVRGGDSVTLTGISFDPAFSIRRHDAEIGMEIAHAYAGVPHRYYNITLSHLPQLWPRITALGYGDLTLSGHVHAMQAAVRLGRFRFSPAQLLYERWSGRYDEGRHTLYINDGIGYVGYPMRLGARPEITILTLRRR